MTMDQPKISRDPSDEGGGSQVKRPRSETDPPDFWSGLPAQNRSSGLFGANHSSANPPQTTSLFGSPACSTPSFSSATTTSSSLFGTDSTRGQHHVFGRPAPRQSLFGAWETNFASTTSNHDSEENEPGVGTSTAPRSIFDFSQPSSASASAPQSLFPQQSTQQNVSNPEFELASEAASNQQGDESPVTPQPGNPIKQEVGQDFTATDAPTNITPAPIPVPVEVLDPRGDLTLVAGHPGIKFRVCSRALARSSPVWDVMLFGSFSEGQDQQKSGDDDWTVTLPDDSPDSLRILLNAAHSKFDAIPTTLPNESIFNLTVLSDKYDMVGLLKPFWSNWVGKLGVAPGTPLGFVQRLWIDHTLGYLQCYKATLKELMSHLRVFNDKPGIFLQCYHEENLSENIHLQALGVLGKCRVTPESLVSR